MPNSARIKTEPGLETPLNLGQPYQPQSAMPALPNATPAAQRAAQHLHQSYGPRAAASINAIQAGGQQQAQAQQNGQGGHVQQMQQIQRMSQVQQQQVNQGQRPQMTQDQYRQMMAVNTANRLAQQTQPNGQNGLQGAQTDGAGDNEEIDSIAIVKRFNANGKEVTIGRVEIDSLIRNRIESMGHSMEGGGLMLPLRHASTRSSRLRRQGQNCKVRGQVDGGDDDDDDQEDVKNEEFDEDAINSDLDDPDEELNEEEDEDEGMGHIMLCMYDKVQRVKNKWYVSNFHVVSRVIFGMQHICLSSRIAHG